MFGTIVTGIVCFLGGAAVMWFVARNNKEKFMKALSSDSKAIFDQLLAEVDEDGKAKELVEKLKAKLDK